MRLGDLDALKAKLVHDYAYVVASIVDKQPTIDAVFVVRCKDCVSGPQRADARIFHCNVLGCGGMKPNDYCSYGERKEDNLNVNHNS